tara:strand:+ start:614 stop:850 length:237 start_codon:yes stop_codon:yes gene_type:complete
MLMKFVILILIAPFLARGDDDFNSRTALKTKTEIELYKIKNDLQVELKEKAQRKKYNIRKETQSTIDQGNNSELSYEN